jgi:hypothetical protein
MGMPAVQSRRTGLTVADDSQRMLLWCLLHDAFEWHNAATRECPACLYAGGTCQHHWSEHGMPAETYIRLMNRLESFQGVAFGIACPLDSADLAIVAVNIHPIRAV